MFDQVSDDGPQVLVEAVSSVGGDDTNTDADGGGEADVWVRPDIDLGIDRGGDDEGDEPTDLIGGHIDVDTASFLAAIGNGSTDGHVHEYDDKFGVTGVDYFDLFADALHEIDRDVPTGQRFKLLVVNADLSVGGRLSINARYSPDWPTTWDAVDVYDDDAPEDLPVYSLDGVAGSTRLDRLALHFDPYAIPDRELIPTQTGCVRKNEPGPDGEWRNGALTLQAVAVAADGSDAFEVEPSLSAGDHGAATRGLLWEATLFWHWSGPCFHDSGWETWTGP